MSLKQYEAYKNSGVTWLEEIPKAWHLDRTKNIGVVKARVGWKALKASEYVSSGYFFLSTPNINKKIIDFENVNYINSYRYYESPEIMLKDEDILLVKDGSTLGIVNYIDKLENEGTVNSSIAILRFKKQHNKFFYYFLKSKYIQNVIGSKKEGMGVPHLFQKDINNFILCIPPKDEQAQIIKFLDNKTDAIDKKVALLGKKISYYQELKISLVNETVTQGLDKTVKFKFSGIDWIGKIPEHWKVNRIDNLFKQRTDKVSDKEYPALSVTKNGIVPQLKNAAKTKHGDNRRKVLKNDFVINSRSDRKGSSGYSKYDGSVSVINIVIEPSREIDVMYYHNLFRSKIFTEEFYRQGQGIVDDLWSTKYSSMKTIQVCIPTRKEQVQIATYLAEKTQKIETIVKNIRQQISVLKEYRKILINDAVTGKIKVIET